MEFQDLVSNLIIDTKGSAAAGLSVTADSSLWAFAPEIVLCTTIVLMLLIRVFNWGIALDRWIGRQLTVGLAFLITLIGACTALVLASPLAQLQTATSSLADPATVSRMEIFTGMLVVDTFTVYIRAILLLFVVLFIFFTWLSGIPDREDGPDIYTLVLGSTLGMMLMASANHLMMVFMAVEMASVPSYVLAGMLKGRKQSSEAALKYSVYGAGAAGLLLYGISLVAGLLHTAHLPTIALRLAEHIPQMPVEEGFVLALGGLLIMCGLAFKLSAVPFHFWCPDVFEGAAAEVGAFLSVASKAAALALLVRVALGVSALPPEGFQPGQRTAMTGSQPAAQAAASSSPATKQVQAHEVPLSDRQVALLAADDPAPAAAKKSGKDEKSGKDKAQTGEKKAGEKKAGEKKAGEKKAGEKKAGEKKAGENKASEDKVPENKAGSETETVEDTASPSDDATASSEQLSEQLAPVRSYVGKLIALFAVLTCTFGNLAAYGQTNIKRLLAYSTIAHAGYMMMAASPMVALSGVDPESAKGAVAGLSIYIATYLFMNLGAFAVVAFLRNEMRSEEISDYAGLIRRCPLTVIAFALMLFSLVGLPPLAGFIGKFAIFASLANGFQVTSENYLMALLVVGSINTAISLFYYLRVVKVMTMDPEPDSRRPVSMPMLQGGYLFLLTLPTVLLIFSWNWLSEMTIAASRHLLS